MTNTIPSLGIFGERLFSNRQNTPTGRGPELEVSEYNKFGPNTALVDFDIYGTQGIGEKWNHIFGKDKDKQGKNNPCKVRERLIHEGRLKACEIPKSN